MIWKEYPKNKNYLVSNTGLIKSKRYDKVLTPKDNWDGYKRIQIWDKGKCSMVGYHRVVAETFVDNPNSYNIVNHIDGDKSNNHPDNLEWVTQKQNIHHAWKTGLSTPTYNHPSTSVRVGCEYDGELVEYPSYSEAQRVTGIPRHVIRRHIISGEPLQGCVWKWLDKTSND